MARERLSGQLWWCLRLSLVFLSLLLSSAVIYFGCCCKGNNYKQNSRTFGFKNKRHCLPITKKNRKRFTASAAKKHIIYFYFIKNSSLVHAVWLFDRRRRSTIKFLGSYFFALLLQADDNMMTWSGRKVLEVACRVWRRSGRVDFVCLHD